MSNTDLLAKIAPHTLSLEESAARRLLPEVLDLREILELWQYSVGATEKAIVFKRIIIPAIVNNTLKIRRLHAFNADVPLPELPVAEDHTISEVAACLACRTGRLIENRRVALLIGGNEWTQGRISDHAARTLLQEVAPPFPSALEEVLAHPGLEPSSIGIHRDDFRFWLESVEEWPIDMRNPLFGWIDTPEAGTGTTPPPANKPTKPPTMQAMAFAQFLAHVVNHGKYTPENLPFNAVTLVDVYNDTVAKKYHVTVKDVIGFVHRNRPLLCEKVGVTHIAFSKNTQNSDIATEIKNLIQEHHFTPTS
ncbi:MAG: hypothetical protein HQL87_14420 [Magnetococcales bacterium]|nr:hypothetical protein [Magnetococcales bacterium]